MNYEAREIANIYKCSFGNTYTIVKTTFPKQTQGNLFRPTDRRCEI